MLETDFHILLAPINEQKGDEKIGAVYKYVVRGNPLFSQHMLSNGDLDHEIKQLAEAQRQATSSDKAKIAEGSAAYELALKEPKKSIPSSADPLTPLYRQHALAGMFTRAKI